MDFIKKFKKLFIPRKSKTEKIDIKIDGVVGFLENEKNKIIAPILDDIKGLYKELGKITKDISDDLNRLKKAELEPGTDSRLQRIAQDNRSSLVQKINIFLSSLPDKYDEKADLKCAGRLVKSLREMATKCTRNIAICGRFFKQETGALLAELRRLEKVLEKLEKSLNIRNKKAKPLNDIKRVADSAIADIKMLKKLRLALSCMQADLGKNKEELEKTREIINELNKNTEMLSLLDEMDILQRKLQQSRLVVTNSISPLNKPMKKFMHDFGVSKQDAKILDSYLKNPLQTAKDDRLETLKKVLPEIRANISKLTSSAMEKKVLREIDHILGGSADSKLEELLSLEAWLAEIRLRTGDFRARREKIDIKIKELEKRAMDIKKDIGKTRDKIRTTESHVKKVVQELEKGLSEITGKEVKVSFGRT
jgi:chromosome segregation ATPase